MEKIVAKFDWLIVTVFLIMAIAFIKNEFIKWDHVTVSSTADWSNKLSETFQITPALIIIFFNLVAHLATKKANS